MMDEVAPVNAVGPGLSTQTLPQLLWLSKTQPDHIPSIEDEYALHYGRLTEPYTYDFQSFCAMMQSSGAVVSRSTALHFIYPYTE